MSLHPPPPSGAHAFCAELFSSRTPNTMMSTKLATEAMMDPASIVLEVATSVLMLSRWMKKVLLRSSGGKGRGGWVGG